MKRGYKEPLELEDLPNISGEDQSGKIFEKFYAIYKHEEVSLFRGYFQVPETKVPLDKIPTFFPLHG